MKGKKAAREPEESIVRLTVDLTKDAHDELEALRRRLGFASKAEVFRRSLKLLDQATSYREQGWEFRAERDGETVPVFVLGV